MAPHKTLLIMSMTPKVPYHTRVPCVSRLTVPAVPRCTDLMATLPRVVDGGVTATGVLSRQRGNLITIVITHY